MTVTKRKVSIVSALLFFILSFYGVCISLASVNEGKTEASVASSIACWFGGGNEESLPVLMYKAVNSDLVPFTLTSKSGAIVTRGEVDGGLNSILELGAPEGTDFKSVNERILGRPLNPQEAGKLNKNSNKDSKPEFNGGPKVSPYDRFGVEGLEFSIYQGEWRYYPIENMCSGEAHSGDNDSNAFYSGRLTPKPTFWASFTSDDIRAKTKTVLFAGVMPAFMMIVAQMAFFVTKLFVTFTIALVGFAFTDLISLVGIDNVVAGDSGTGIAPTLYNNLFLPMTSIVFVFTGLYVGYTGIVQRKVRESFGVLIRSVSLFLAAVFVFTNASFFMKLPNNVAIVGQALVMNAMSTGVAGGNGLCQSDLANAPLVDGGPTDVSNVKESRGILEKASVTIRSQVGCQFWQMFLLRPYIQGQWGTDWEKLWDKTAEQTYSTSRASGTLPNTNGDWVGDASVPLGGGEFIKNWAIFQISTQTNAHNPIGKDGELPVYVNNRLAGDWWRVVDAVSNYNEKDESYTIQGLRGQSEQASAKVADKTAEVTPYYGDWTGVMSAWSRVGIALSSILVAVVGLFAPFVFALLSAVVAIKISLLVAVSPVAFLVGCYPKGFEMFKGWGESVLNATIERIMLGLLLSVSLVFTSSALDIVENESWFKGILVLAVLSLVLVKSRKKIMTVIAGFRFSSMGFGRIADSIGSKAAGFSKTGAGMAASGAVGGWASRKEGGSFREGFKKATARKLRNEIYASGNHTARLAMSEYDAEYIAETGEIPDQQFDRVFCQGCGRPLDLTPGSCEVFARDSSGHFYCKECYDSGFAEDDAQEVILDHKSEKPSDERTFASQRGTLTASVLDGEVGTMNAVKMRSSTVSAEEKTRIANSYTNSMGSAFATLQNLRTKGETNRFVLPEQLKPYINADAFEREANKLFDRRFIGGSDGVPFNEEAASVQMSKVADVIAVAIQKQMSAVQPDSSGSLGVNSHVIPKEVLARSIVDSYNANVNDDTYKVSYKETNA